MVEPVENGGPNKRAPRFSIAMPMRYRMREESEWRDGNIENISRSGVLFRGERFLEVAARVEITFVLPVSVRGEVPAKVICQGQIVRTARSTRAQSFPALAATILNYRFLRGRGSRHA